MPGQDHDAARIEAVIRLLDSGNPAEALAAVDSILDENDRDTDAEAHFLRALALTAIARIEDADRAFSRAAALDPEEYFEPYRLERDEFDLAVEEVLSGLPAEFADYLANVEVAVEDVPTEELLDEEDGLGLDLLGVYIGQTVEAEDWAMLPDRVVLFQWNLENISPDRETLLAEIRDTLLHEVGHHFGMDEETLREIEDTEED